jgi:hypothetical protein
MLDRARCRSQNAGTIVKDEREPVSIQPRLPAVRPLIQTAGPARRARRRYEAIIQAELRRLAHLGGRVVSEPVGASDSEYDPRPDRAA